MKTNIKQTSWAGKALQEYANRESEHYNDIVQAHVFVKIYALSEYQRENNEISLYDIIGADVNNVAFQWRPNSAYTALIHFQGRAVDIDNAIQSLYHIKGVCPSVNNFIANPKRLFENYKFNAKRGV